MGILLLVPILYFSSIWIFAHYGGEWATSNDIPIPENSQFHIATYEHKFYSLKNSFYTSNDSPEEIRQWFIDSGISMSPIQLDLEGSSFIEYDDYYQTLPLFQMRSMLQELHDSSVRYVTPWWSDFTVSCQLVRVYKNHSAFLDAFPEINLTSVSVDSTIFLVRTCWANVR